jgi:hypothetical protein
MQLTELDEMLLVEEAREVVKITPETTEQQISNWVRNYSRLNWGNPLEREWLLERRIAQLEAKLKMMEG